MKASLSTDEEIAFLEFSLDVIFPASTCAMMRSHASATDELLRKGFGHPEELRQGIAEAQSTWANLQRALKLTLQAKLVPVLRREASNPLSAVLLHSFDAAHPPVVAGDPPLMPEMSDALLEAAYSIGDYLIWYAPDIPAMCRTPLTDFTPATMTQQGKLEHARMLASSYHVTNPLTWKALADFTPKWFALKAVWGDLALEMRQPALEEVRRYIAPLLPQVFVHPAAIAQFLNYWSRYRIDPRAEAGIHFAAEALPEPVPARGPGQGSVKHLTQAAHRNLQQNWLEQRNQEELAKILWNRGLIYPRPAPWKDWRP